MLPNYSISVNQCSKMSHARPSVDNPNRILDEDLYLTFLDLVVDRYLKAFQHVNEHRYYMKVNVHTTLTVYVSDRLIYNV